MWLNIVLSHSKVYCKKEKTSKSHHAQFFWFSCIGFIPGWGVYSYRGVAKFHNSLCTYMYLNIIPQWQWQKLAKDNPLLLTLNFFWNTGMDNWNNLRIFFTFDSGMGIIFVNRILFNITQTQAFNSTHFYPKLLNVFRA